LEVNVSTPSSQTNQRARVLYRRELPGGGYVDVHEDGRIESDGHEGHISVERRSDPTRRDGHAPPVIASAQGKSTHSVFRQLLEIASDNVAIARALLRWQSDGRARF
jgi:hypothetical protein